MANANLNFAANSNERAVFIEWRKSLEERAAAGTRARIKRCSSIDQALLERSIMVLSAKLGAPNDDRIGLMGMLSVHAKHSEGMHPAKAFAKGKDKPVVSELRFRRLLDITEREELPGVLRRLLVLADGDVDMGILAKSMWFWNDQTKREWADAYYNNGPKDETEA